MRPKRSGRRTIVVDGHTYEWIVGRQYARIRKDGMLLVHTTIAAIKNSSPWTVERGKRKGTSDGMLTPREVREFIQRTVTA